VLVATWLKESLPSERRRPILLTSQLQAYGALARDLLFMRHVIATSLMFAAMFGYIAGSSFVLQDSFGLSAQEFSAVFAINGLGLVLMGKINGRIVGVLAPQRVLMLASLLAGSMGAIGVLTSALLGLSLWVLLPSLFMVVAPVGPVLANGTSPALADHSARAGAASSLQGLLQFLIGGTAAAAMDVLGHGLHGMTVAMAVCTLSALAVFASTLREVLPSTA
jgi:MFS transporter, DHA1 family, multidrug resistance protein